MEPNPKEKKKRQCKKKNSKRNYIIRRCIELVLFVFFLGLFLSSPLWLPPTLSILRKAEAVAHGPKGLFIICNVIVVILISESKFLTKSSCQPASINETYAKLNRSNQNESKKFLKKWESEGAEVEEEEGYEDVEEFGEKELDELNKRVEDFIAMVNRQRKLEAKLIACRHG